MSLISKNDVDVEVIYYRRLLRHMKYVRDNLESILCIKVALEDFDESYAEQLWNELDTDARIALITVAPSKGGIFRTKERAFLRTIGIEVEK